jgi:hypothetical protein
MLHRGEYIDDAEVARARRQSVSRWFMDHEGNIWINRASARRKPITFAEIAAMDEAVEAFIARGGRDPVH